jgi:molybdopterin-guanine dinucleotide biosynthesis protein A
VQKTYRTVRSFLAIHVNCGDSALLSKSAIILAGGSSSRFGQDKGLLQLANKPLIKHVLDRIDNIVDEKLIVVSSKAQVEKYLTVIDASVNVLVDKADVCGPLAGALAGFEEACGEYSLLLPCDTPLVSRDILLLLLELRINRNAVIPRWPSGYIEPLQAVYRTKPALEAARNALRAGELNVQAMVDRLRSIRYVSTLVLEQLDPELKTFLNINTPLDLKKTELMLKRLNASQPARLNL